MAKYQWLEPIKGKLEGDECLKGGGDGEGKRKRDSVVAKKSEGSWDLLVDLLMFLQI